MVRTPASRSALLIRPHLNDANPLLRRELQAPVRERVRLRLLPFSCRLMTCLMTCRMFK
jgi:hypothetical protein